MQPEVVDRTEVSSRFDSFLVLSRRLTSYGPQAAPLSCLTNKHLARMLVLLVVVVHAERARISHSLIILWRPSLGCILGLDSSWHHLWYERYERITGVVCDGLRFLS